ncbi:hypothetical protein [Actinophytocola gossypii]|uniref:PE domain-containing protein n=1 Tax=Actinophytocola gossypii TaxID=2812003 RepID=A0ABT2JF68_9PSEU|nr:hypothetical protein [Actinophytocola gossypii]MCT2585924.1 hypothetical protein [Actinophytocola gossypii]
MHVAGGIGSIVGSAKSFANLASTGGFAVNETGGQALLAAIREMRDWIDAQGYGLNMLAQQPPLGSSHGAETMKPYVADVASDKQGFITMLQEFRTSLDDAERGIQAAMASYQETDTGIGGGFQQV